MKKLFLPLLFTLTVFSACAQESRVDQVIDKYSAQTSADGNISLSIDPSFLLNASFAGADTQGWAHKITQVRMLILDNKKASFQQEWDDITGSVKDGHYEELMNVRKGSDKVQLLSKDGKDNLKEVVLLAGSKDSGGVFLVFRGHFTSADIDKMLSSVGDGHASM